jgi:hemerythrin superfamily protein
MARATPSRATDSPRDAVALLKQDHRTVEMLFDEFEDAEEQEQSQLAERICNMLTVHAQIEEEIVYPAAKQAFEEEEELDLVNEAAVEHASAKDLIAKIEAMSPEDEAFKATVKVLSEYIKHHVKEEENELFPALKQTDLDLKEMGAQLAERKFALMEEMGIEAEEPPAPKRKKSNSRASKSASASKARQARAGSRKTAKSASGRSTRH